VTQLVDAAPRTICGAMLVEMRRLGVHCSANDPVVSVNALNIESAGNGIATVQESVMPGTTGAWISVERPFLLGWEHFDGAW
jgi:hypothetical protein